MKEIMYNKNKITKKDITKTIIRVNILMLNSLNEILLVLRNDTYEFPEFHLEKSESLIPGVIRGISEITGIDVVLNELEPFLIKKHYKKNYHGTGKNYCSSLYYVSVHTDQKIDLDKVKSFEGKERSFELKYVSLEKIEEILNKSIPLSDDNERLVAKMLTAINEYKNKINLT